MHRPHARVPPPPTHTHAPTHRYTRNSFIRGALAPAAAAAGAASDGVLGAAAAAAGIADTRARPAARAPSEERRADAAARANMVWRERAVCGEERATSFFAGVRSEHTFASFRFPFETGRHGRARTVDPVPCARAAAPSASLTPRPPHPQCGRPRPRGGLRHGVQPPRDDRRLHPPRPGPVHGARRPSQPPPWDRHARRRRQTRRLALQSQAETSPPSSPPSQTPPPPPAAT